MPFRDSLVYSENSWGPSTEPCVTPEPVGDLAVNNDPLFSSVEESFKPAKAFRADAPCTQVLYQYAMFSSVKGLYDIREEDVDGNALVQCLGPVVPGRQEIGGAGSAPHKSVLCLVSNAKLLQLLLQKPEENTLADFADAAQEADRSVVQRRKSATLVLVDGGDVAKVKVC